MLNREIEEVINYR